MRHRHGDRVHPADTGDLELGSEIEHRLRERVPGEVGLVPREQQERLTEHVVGQGELEPRGPELRQVILFEHDHRATSAVVEQNVVVEDDQRLRIGRLLQMVDEPGHGVAGIREAGQQHDEGQTGGNGRRIRHTFEEITGEGHVSMLRAASDRRAGVAVSEHGASSPGLDRERIPRMGA